MKAVKNLTLSSLFLAIGIILPFFTGQIPQVGSMLLPMHIPIFLCAFVCGWKSGALIAIILPLLRSVVFSRPNFYPEAISIALEMATYALVSGLLYEKSRWQCIRSLYRSLIVGMFCGRLVRGAVQFALLAFMGAEFTFYAFFTGVILTGLPGVALQLIIIPAIMVALDKTKIVKFKKTCKKLEDNRAV